jgi:CBS domain containing-hemolysin-like protein
VADPAVAHVLESALEPLGLPHGLVEALGFGIALSIVVFLHLVVGEMAPKYLALTMPEKVLLWLVVPLRGFTAVFRPVIWALARLANAGTRLLGVEPAEELAATHTSDELAVMLAESRKEGLLEQTAHDLLSGALDFGEEVVATVMVPRDDVVTVPRTATVEQAEQVVVRSGHSRLPVTGRDLDDIVGFVHAKDLLTVPLEARNRSLPVSRLHRMLKVPASRPIDQVMLEMRRSRIHLAVVEGEEHRMAGIATLEDVIEELVGDIVDETDRGRRRRLGGAGPMSPT